MTDPAVVMRKIATMRDHCERIRRRRPPDREALLDDEDRQDALALSLLVATQEAIDIAFHVATDDGLGVPASHAEAFGLLAAAGIIDSELATTVASVARLRNRIAHGYAQVDMERVWRELPAGLEALEAFAVAVARHIG